MNGNLFGKKIFGVLVLALSVGLLLTAGCTGSQGPPADTGIASERTGTPVPTQGAGQAAQGNMVHYTTLMNYLPTAPSTGWTNGEPAGMQASDGGYTWSWAARDYEQAMGGDAMVEIVIQDTNDSLVGEMAAWDSYMEVETPVMSMKQATVGGYPAWVITDTESDTITQIVNIDDRFIVYTWIEGGKADYLTVFNTLTDFKGIAGLA